MQTNRPFKLEHHAASSRDVLSNEEFIAKAVQPEESEEDEVPVKFDGTVLYHSSPGSIATTTTEPHHLQQSNEANEEEDRPQDSEIGWIAEIRHLYATKDSSDSGKTLYTSKVPIARGIGQRLAEGQSNDEARTFAILHYHDESLQTSSIDIQSPELKKGLTHVLLDYPDVYTDAPVLSFSPPFLPFLHSWDRFLQAEKASSEENKKLFDILRQDLERELKEPFKVWRDYERTKYIEFDDLLVAFVPGELVATYRKGVLWAGVLLDAWIRSFMGQKSCCLKVRVVDWDGTRFGYREKTWVINGFKGFRKITDLSAFPMDADSDRGQIKQRLVERGKVFHRLCGQHIKSYTGVVHFKRDKHKTAHLSERIIVDAYAFYKFQHKYVPELSDLDGGEGEEAPDSCSVVSNNYSSSQQPNSLSEADLIIAVPYVRGFALKSKAWHKFDINNISPVAWNEKLLGNLVIQEQEKRLLLALVRDQGSPEDEKFDDFIEDKGKGLILLLAGPPGVGKTLTAETVAEELKRPLYRIGAGDLGISAHSVETSLKKAFDQCSHWSAVLLIDEADVFLERRSSDRLDQNELVSIFLTTLEYYTGTLILTTNRCSDIDPAFEFRIDIILTYNNLDKDSRRQIWSNFIARVPKGYTDIQDSDLDSLSNWELNGRQIKSAIKAAQIMAKSTSTPLRVHHLEDVLEIRKRGSRVLGTEIIH
ncbi:P-loop containing nucleoside triphosphate hydrolase protein [Fusarium oxysporum f. sp. albedinis]|nr:P-loop containing nucleoside triphosphate hydrolase protein [Fusarium oxysporum f. sp. albedinis]KAJ0126048.1 Uncharacterized protein HZ326_30845 [Fusarium oxysporum f. sp. albedinis]